MKPLNRRSLHGLQAHSIPKKQVDSSLGTANSHWFHHFIDSRLDDFLSRAASPIIPRVFFLVVEETLDIHSPERREARSAPAKHHPHLVQQHRQCILLATFDIERLEGVWEDIWERGGGFELVADVEEVREANSHVFQRGKLGQRTEPFVVGLVGARDSEGQVVAAVVEPERLQRVPFAGQGVVEGGRLIPLGVEVRI